MPNFENGKIYRIVNTEGTLTYIGSTTQSLAMRKGKHKFEYEKWKTGNSKKYLSSFEVFKNDEDGCKIIIIESFPCKNKDELRARERFYIESIDCVNKRKPGRTNAMYYKENHEHCLKIRRDYRNENKAKIYEIQKQYRVNNAEKISEKKKTIFTCECGVDVQCNHKSRHFKSNAHIKFVNSKNINND
jgi:hypothetical protein